MESGWGPRHSSRPPRTSAAGLRPPRKVATGLAPGVGDLDARDGPLRLNEAGDTGQRLDVLLAPDTHIAGGDPAVAGNGRGLDHHQRHPADGPTAEVDEVPVAG